MTRIIGLDFRIAVGCGIARALCNGIIVYDGEEHMNRDQCVPLSVRDIERFARGMPDATWQIILETPLGSETFIRQAPDTWVAKNQRVTP